MVAAPSDRLVPECTARDGYGVSRRIPCIGEYVPVGIVNCTEFESPLGGTDAKRFDIRHIEHELGDAPAGLPAAAQRVKHDVASGPVGVFQLDDSITVFPVNPEAEMERIEVGDRLDVADVEQNSAKHGSWWET